MARIIGGSPLGELSGKMGGMVFARNKSGPYMRQYVIPVNPNSTAQVNSRAKFSNAAAGWHSLSNLVKAQWQSYATNVFSPKNTPNLGQFSGFAAHTALRNVIANADSRIADVTFNSNSGALTPTYEDFFLTNVPPTQAASGTLGILPQPGGTGSAILTLDAVTLYDDFNGLYRFGLTGIETSTNNAPGQVGINSLYDPAADELFGFAIYMSNPVRQSQDFVQNPFLINIGYIAPVIAFAGAGTDNVTWIQAFITDPKMATANYQALPAVGDIVRVTAVQTTHTGQQKVIGSRMVTISTV